MNKKAGFSMIELMVYLAIVGLLLITVGPMVLSRLGTAKTSKTKQTLAALKGGVTTYYLEFNKYPTVLEDLVRKPKDVPGWHAEIDPDTVKWNEDKTKIVDAWDTPFHYRITKGGTHQYELYSEGDPDASEPAKIDAWNLG